MLRAGEVIDVVQASVLEPLLRLDDKTKKPLLVLRDVDASAARKLAFDLAQQRAAKVFALQPCERVLFDAEIDASVRESDVVKQRIRTTAADSVVRATTTSGIAMPAMLLRQTTIAVGSDESKHVERWRAMIVQQYLNKTTTFGLPTAIDQTHYLTLTLANDVTVSFESSTILIWFDLIKPIAEQQSNLGREGARQ